VLFSCAAISTACWVWTGSRYLPCRLRPCGSGMVLLGLSIWHSVEFGVSGSLKLQAELERSSRR
jgi:hypothetical protein